MPPTPFVLTTGRFCIRWPPFLFSGPFCHVFWSVFLPPTPSCTSSPLVPHRGVAVFEDFPLQQPGRFDVSLLCSAKPVQFLSFFCSFFAFDSGVPLPGALEEARAARGVFLVGGSQTFSLWLVYFFRL